MKSLFSSVSLLALCGSTVLLGGCEAKDCTTEEGNDAVCAASLKVFEAQPQTLEQDYLDGAQVNIKGLYGDILVRVGSPGVVSAEFTPFNYRGEGEDLEAKQELEDNIDLAAETDADGNVTISVGRHGATNGLGSHITVSLPPEFNGPLVVENDGEGVINQGAIDVSFVGDSTVLNVVNHGLENCNILRGTDSEPVAPSALTSVDVRCGADITVRGVNDDVVVHSAAEFHSNIRVEIASVSATSNGGRINGDDTSIELILPEGGNFNVDASVGAGATIKNLDLPASCEASVDEPSAKLLSCGTGGAVYQVSTKDADPDDDDTSFIRVLVQ